MHLIQFIFQNEKVKIEGYSVKYSIKIKQILTF